MEGNHSNPPSPPENPLKALVSAIGHCAFEGTVSTAISQRPQVPRRCPIGSSTPSEACSIVDYPPRFTIGLFHPLS
jgi:hypothetical protein